MTYQEILETIEKVIQDEEQQMAQKIKLSNGLRCAVEKQIPQKPIEKEVIGVSMTGYKYKGQCPKCSSTVSQCTGNFCPKCGQALDWSEYNVN